MTTKNKIESYLKLLTACDVLGEANMFYSEFAQISNEAEEWIKENSYLFYDGDMIRRLVYDMEYKDAIKIISRELKDMK